MALPVTVSNFLRSPGRDTAAAVIVAVQNRRRRLARERRGPRANREPEGVRSRSDVVVYFAEDPRRLYQLEQWLPVLSELNERHGVQIVLRKLRSYELIQEMTTLPAVYARRLADVLEIYDEVDPKVAIYVNNGVSNFQSLAVPTILHVHVNHGESDKISMVSNQAKAYDRVFVAGEAAERRHAAALIDFDHRALIRVGRPQLDLQFPPSLPETSRKTVIYAPTWEGENEFNNYTSIDRYGVRIVQALLAQPGLRVIYRPHPRVATSTTPEILGGHRQVMEQLNAAAVTDPGAGHAIAMDGSILALFQHCDAMVTDVSSVGLDFLYLRTDKPIFLTDRRDDRTELALDAPISAAADIIDSSTIATFGSVVSARLADDVLAGARREMRRFYFGDLAPGESTQRFLDAVSDVVRERDALVAGLSHPHAHAAGAAAAAGDMSGDEDYAAANGADDRSDDPAAEGGNGEDGADPAAREAIAEEALEAEPAQGR
jgi:CDP-glycerol:poly(glycerophosphate) glycerophosphotransferase